MKVKILQHPKRVSHIHDRYNSMMRDYLKEVNLYNTQTGVHPGISGPEIWPYNRHQIKSNYTASTLVPQPMPGWHLKVPVTHLDKALPVTTFIAAISIVQL